MRLQQEKNEVEAELARVPTNNPGRKLQVGLRAWGGRARSGTASAGLYLSHNPRPQAVQKCTGLPRQCRDVHAAASPGSSHLPVRTPAGPPPQRGAGATAGGGKQGGQRHPAAAEKDGLQVAAALD